MELIVHRVSTVADLKTVPHNYGVEIDLRDQGKRLILQHDPFKDGQDFEEFLQHYKHSTMILNVKSERIEFKILELLKRYNVKQYFFLDCSFPMIYSLSKNGEKNIALRYSEFEGLDTILNMSSKINWVWVDCFSRIPLDNKTFQILKNNGFKLCFVSPELQGQSKKIDEYIQYLERNDIKFDAVCTKLSNVKKWQILL